MFPLTYGTLKMKISVSTVIDLDAFREKKLNKQSLQDLYAYKKAARRAFKYPMKPKEILDLFLKFKGTADELKELTSNNVKHHIYGNAYSNSRNMINLLKISLERSLDNFPDQRGAIIVDPYRKILKQLEGF